MQNNTSDQIPVNMPSNQKFGWMFVAIFTVGGFYSEYNYFTWLAIASIFFAAIFLLITIRFPSALTPLNKYWFKLGLLLGKVVSPVVLSLIFLVLITPVALITRLFGRDVLFLKKRKASSYWVEKESIDPNSFKNQH